VKSVNKAIMALRALRNVYHDNNLTLSLTERKALAYAVVMAIFTK
jgi:hypothetical protein